MVLTFRASAHGALRCVQKAAGDPGKKLSLEPAALQAEASERRSANWVTHHHRDLQHCGVMNWGTRWVPSSLVCARLCC